MLIKTHKRGLVIHNVNVILLLFGDFMIFFNFMIFTILITWIESTVVFNGYGSKNVTVVRDRFNKKIQFRISPISFKKPYPFQVSEKTISLSKQVMNKYVNLSSGGLEFDCHYQIVDFEKAYYLGDFKEYLFDLISTLIIENEDKFNSQKDLEAFILLKSTNAAIRHGIQIHGFILRA